MSLTVFLAVIAAAAMHASWNALVKVRTDRFASISISPHAASETGASSPKRWFTSCPP